MEPTGTALRAVRTILFEAVSADLDVLLKISFPPEHQARLVARTRDLLPSPARKRQPPPSTKQPGPLQHILQNLRVVLAGAAERSAPLWHGLRPKVVDGTTLILKP